MPQLAFPLLLQRRGGTALSSMPASCARASRSPHRSNPSQAPRGHQIMHGRAWAAPTTKERRRLGRRRSRPCPIPTQARGGKAPAQSPPPVTRMEQDRLAGRLSRSPCQQSRRRLAQVRASLGWPSCSLAVWEGRWGRESWSVSVFPTAKAGEEAVEWPRPRHSPKFPPSPDLSSRAPCAAVL